MTSPQFKELHRVYGFDEVAIVPGNITINPDQTNIDFKINNLTFSKSVALPELELPTKDTIGVITSFFRLNNCAG